MDHTALFWIIVSIASCAVFSAVYVGTMQSPATHEWDPETDGYRYCIVETSDSVLMAEVYFIDNVDFALVCYWDNVSPVNWTKGQYWTDTTDEGRYIIRTAYWDDLFTLSDGDPNHKFVRVNSPTDTTLWQE